MNDELAWSVGYGVDDDYAGQVVAFPLHRHVAVHIDIVVGQPTQVEPASSSPHQRHVYHVLKVFVNTN